MILYKHGYVRAVDISTVNIFKSPYSTSLIFINSLRLLSSRRSVIYELTFTEMIQKFRFTASSIYQYRKDNKKIYKSVYIRVNHKGITSFDPKSLILNNLQIGIEMCI